MLFFGVQAGCDGHHPPPGRARETVRLPNPVRKSAAPSAVARAAESGRTRREGQAAPDARFGLGTEEASAVDGRRVEDRGGVRRNADGVVRGGGVGRGTGGRAARNSEGPTAKTERQSDGAPA